MPFSGNTGYYLPDLYKEVDQAMSELAAGISHQQIEEAERQQQALRQQVITHDDLPPHVSTVAGVDVAYEKDSSRLVAAVAVLDAQTLKVVQVVSHRGETTFPYVPGLFSFRELPAILKALEQLAAPPDLIVCDGQGLAHPRRFGLACHLGVSTGIPTIGCAKTRLTGEYQTLGETRGSTAELWDAGEVVGRAVRTQSNINPLFVSVGHRVSLQTATDWVLRLAPHYRLPETTRAADHAVKTLLQANSEPRD